MAHLTTDPSDRARWVCLMAVYINASKTLPDGRKISKEKAVKDPTLEEIKKALELKRCGLKFDIEKKRYPRDFMELGRFRVQLKDAEGNDCNPAISSRKALFEFVAEAIKKSPERAAKLKEQQMQAAAAAKAEVSAQQSAGKKGKRGRRGKR
eukprot:m.290645 g.290645  ORF g.290645 m.290645 type:complete len:152 (+) comp19469_c3_seq1:1843-2298(+)